MINLTEKAADKIKELFKSQGTPESSRNLRIAIMGGGCSGFQYDLGFDETRPSDKIFESFGVKIVCDPKSYLYVNGSEIDYHDHVLKSGFVVTNPNAKSSCGCGESFHI